MSSGLLVEPRVHAPPLGPAIAQHAGLHVHVAEVLASGVADEDVVGPVVDPDRGEPLVACGAEDRAKRGLRTVGRDLHDLQISRPEVVRPVAEDHRPIRLADAYRFWSADQAWRANYMRVDAERDLGPRPVGVARPRGPRTSVGVLMDEQPAPPAPAPAPTEPPPVPPRPRP